MADPFLQPLSDQPDQPDQADRHGESWRDAGQQHGDDASRLPPYWLAEALARRGIPYTATAHRLLDEHDLPSEEEEHLRVPLGTPHHVLCADIYPGVKSRYAGRPDVVVAADLFVYYERVGTDGQPQAARLAPDVFVAFGVPLRDRQSYVAWRESIVPTFVLEVLSPNNWRNDVYKKPPLYAAMGVGEYFLFDAEDHIEPRLQGYELHGGSYRPLPSEVPLPGVRGIRSKALGLYLCHTEPWPDGDHELGTAGKLRWFDPASGQIVLTPDEQVAAAERQVSAAERRVSAAEQRASAAEQQVVSAQQRAVAADGRAAAAQNRLAELEAELAKRQR